MIIRLITSTARPTERQIERLKELGDFEIVDAQKLTSEQVISEIPDVEVLIAGPSGISRISPELLSGLKNLKLISTLSVGTDWVDLEAAKQLNVLVSTIKGANSESVAEHTWAMILDLAKRVTEFDRDVRNKGAYKFGDYRGKEVFGKTIGIIGLGDIGSKVARIAKAFDMKVLGVNQSGKAVTGVELSTLETILEQSDVIAVCVPLTPDTNNMLDTEEFSLMKEEVILVNCSREEAVSKTAVLNALRTRKLWGYGIETEIMKQVAKDDPYLSHPRVVVTPHNAFNTIDAEVKSFDTVIKNIEAYLDGKPQNVANA